MEQLPEHSKKSFDRRRFIGQGIKLTLLAGLVSPLEQACNTKGKDSKEANVSVKKKRQPANNNNKRSRWIRENLVINTKTNVVHLPTSSVYIYYDEIKNSNDVNIHDWENQVQRQGRLNKDKSGNILEILSLHKLQKEINNDSLDSAANTLAKAFSIECENSKGINHNISNYRLHELMLQLVVLNSDISINNKWGTFNELVKMPQRLGKRQNWMSNENNFNERVKYIQDRKEEYKNRLAQRAAQHNLT